MNTVSSVVNQAPVRPRQRSRRRRGAVATAACGYFAAYGAAVLGVIAIFAPTGGAALLTLAAALLMAIVTVVILAVDAVLSPREAPRLA